MLGTGQVEPAASKPVWLETLHVFKGLGSCGKAGSCALLGLRYGIQPSSDVSFFLQVLALCLQLCGQPLKLHWLHKVRGWCREMLPAPCHVCSLPRPSPAAFCSWAAGCYMCTPNCPVPCPTDPADHNCPRGGRGLHRAGNKVGGGVEKRTHLPAGESTRRQGHPHCPII